MHWIIGRLPEILSGMLLLAPLLLSFHFQRFRSWKRTVCYGLFSSYLIAMLCFTGFPNVRYLRFSPTVNLIPVLGLSNNIPETYLNVALFFPMGVLVPILWGYYRKMWRTACFGFLASLTIELSQLFSNRATDVNDLITNTAGAILGYCAAKLLTGGFRRCPENPESDLFILGALVAFVMFFPWPYVYPLFY